MILTDKGMREAEVLHILQERSRDNARTPMQWTRSRMQASAKASHGSRFAPNYPHVNVEANLKDPDSIFHHYQKLIQLRKDLAVIAEGRFVPMLEDHPAVFAYGRILDEEKLIGHLQLLWKAM